MNINIYGVGRSGTKAIQLFITYLIAEREKYVAINYEPYLWRSRKLGNYSYQGISNLFSDKHITNNKTEISKTHQKFIQQLITSDISNVSKFIRANGYINPINDITKPDSSFVVIRGIYDVLSSINRLGFNFYSVGVKWEKPFWNSFVKETLKRNILSEQELINEIKSVKSPLVKNAFYWYIMNLVALDASSSKTYFVNFNSLDDIENKISNILFSKNTDYKLSENKFKGDNIHRNCPLKNINSQNRTFQSIINKLIFYSFGRIIDSPAYLHESTGDVCEINTIITKPNKNRFEKNKLIEKNSMFDYFQEQIDKKLKKVQL